MLWGGWRGGSVAVQCKQYPFVLFLQNAKLFAVEYAHLTHHCYLFIFRPRKHPKVVGAQSHPPHFEPRFGRRREQRRRQRQIPSIDLLLVVQSKLGPQPRVGVVDSSRFNLSNHHDRLFRDIDVEQVSVVAGDGGGGDFCERKD